MLSILSKPFKEITIDELYNIGFQWVDSRKYYISDRLKYEDIAKPDETIYWLEYRTFVHNPKTRHSRYVTLVYYPKNFVGMKSIYAETNKLDPKGLLVMYRTGIDRSRTHHCYPQDIDEIQAILVSETEF